MTSPDPQPFSEGQSLITRLTALQQAHPWMDPHVSTTLASSATSNNELMHIADSLKGKVQQAWDGISHYFDDPVLHKEPTQGLAFQRYLTGAVGPIPVTDTHLSHIQQQLQQGGFGADLPVNGKWDAGWQAALQQHAQAEYQKEASGDKPGSKSTGGLLHSILHSISPSGVASAVTGFVKSIPADVGSLLGDVGTSLGDLQDLTKLSTYEVWSDKATQSRHDAAKRDAKRVETIQDAIGANAYREQVGLPKVTAENYNGVASGINDIGTLFLISGLGGAAKSIGKSFATNNAEGLLTKATSEAALKEATRGPGVVAKSLLRPVGTRIATGAVTGGAVGGGLAAVRGEDIGTGIGQGVAAGALAGAVLPHRAFENTPVLGKTGPLLGKLADADGLYYKARTRLATPYQYGAVRFAGTALSQGQAFSLKAHGVGYLQSIIGGDADTINQAIANSAPLNGINDALRHRLSFTAAGLHFAPDLDYLMYFLHGPTTVGAEGTASAALKGDSDALLAGLQNNNITQQVMQGTDKSYHQLLEDAGGDPNRLNLWISNKTKDAAAHQHATEVYDALRTSMGDKVPNIDSGERLEILKSEAAKVWNDPAAMKTAVARMMGSGENFLATHIKDERTRSAVQPDAYLKHQLSDYLDAGEILTHEVLPFKDTHLLTPQTKTVIPAGMDPAFAEGNPFVQEAKYLGVGETPAGNIGMARLTTLTSQQATLDAQKFKADLELAGDDQHAVTDWYAQAHDYLAHNYGLDAKRLAVFTGTPEKTLSLLMDRAKTLAAEVHLSADAPAELRAAFDRIEATGYRVVVGKDIGHAYRSDLPPLKELGDGISVARKVVSNWGLNPQAFSRIDYGVDRRLRVVTALQRAVDDGRITLPPYYTVQTLLNDLQDDTIVGKQLPWAGNLAFAAARRAHKGTVEELIRLGKAETPAQAEALLKSQIASAGGLRDLRVGDVRRVLTRTTNVPWVSRATDATGQTIHDMENTIPLMDPAHADEVFKAIQKGYSQTPTHMLGLQKVEDFARYLPFRMADKAHVPTNQATLALMNLPNQLAQLRDTYRFNLSPFFDLRRIAKTNVKMSADGVAPTITPVKTLMAQGRWEEAHNTLDRVLGSVDPRYKYLDEADRYLDSAGVFGLYNPRHFEAYYVAQKKSQGATDQEIRDGIVRVFQYGKDGKEGRTAMERSMNTIFFPFSFEKTVTRNVGSYLLDKPAQAMILSNSLDAYRDFNNHHKDNPLAMAWIETHAPLLAEVERLNAFAHGFSMGELGGVNRPLLNAFLPQSWATDKDTVKTLNRFVPAVADLHRIIGEGTQQSRIVRQSVSNGVYEIQHGHSSSLLNGRPVAETDVAQRNDARIFRSTLVSAFKDVLDYNDHAQTDEQKYHFGYGQGIPDNLRGLPINRTNIGYIVHQRYPVYDPLAGAAYAIANKTAAEQYVARSGNPAYADFYRKAQTAVAHLNKDEYPDEQAAQVQDMFRQAAIDYAQTDPSFLRFYNRTLASSFGPLEKV